MPPAHRLVPLRDRWTAARRPQAAELADGLGDREMRFEQYLGRGGSPIRAL